MRQYKKWTRLFLVISAIFLVYNLVVFNLVTKKLDTNNEKVVGDLSRMSYALGSMYLKDSNYSVPIQHIKITEFEISNQIDVLTIGDSFSNGGGQHFYQDFLATANNLNVLNIQPYNDLNYIETIALLQNSGYLEKINPKYIIIQSVERIAIDRFSEQSNFDIKENLNKIIDYYSNSKYINTGPPISFVNTGNFKYPIYSFLYLFSDNAFFSKAYKVELKKDFFSVSKSNDLFFYGEDIKNVSKASVSTINSMNENFNTLANRLEKDGIKLYFMPAPDKYNLYSNYIKNNLYPKSIFFEELRKLEKDYYFIDTKMILKNELDKGEKDIYYSDDTHWGIKASDVITRAIKFD